ncbi:MAG TPA: extracellular solute-binding protein [Halococcus sp.]|nr:extracellular solute-binding protein [Halococcus sp.]
MGDTSQHDGGRSGVSRRSFVKAAGASGVAAGLAGCIYGGSGGGGGGSGATITWGFDPTMAQENGDKITQLFHDNGLSKDITLKLSGGSEKTGNRQKTYQQLLNAGQSSPDMFMMDCGWTIPFIVRDQIMNLSNELPEDNLKEINNEYFDASVQTTKNPDTGDIYGVPLYPDLPTMNYRKDLVKKAGYQPDKKNWASTPMTWKQFNKITSDVMKQTNTDMGYSFQFDAYVGLACCDFNEFLSSWGGAYFGSMDNLFGPVGKRPVTIAKEPVQQALRMVRTFIHGEKDPEALSSYSKIAPTEVLTWTEETSRKPFAAGNVVMHRNWPYVIPLNYEEAKWASPESYGVMPLPYAKGSPTQKGVGGTSPALGGWHTTVNPNTENKEAVMEVIKTQMKDEVQLGIFEIAGWLPPKTKLLDTKAARKVKPTGRYLDTFKVAGKNAVPRPVTVVWPSESKATYQEVNAIAAQKKSVKSGLNTLESRLKKIENSSQ